VTADGVVGGVVVGLIVLVGLLIGYGWLTDKDAPPADRDPKG
jgi:hypothetical protein